VPLPPPQITLQHYTQPGATTSPQIGYAIVRGAENIPITVGDLELPGSTVPCSFFDRLLVALEGAFGYHGCCWG
jgi:hypothetical protein